MTNNSCEQTNARGKVDDQGGSLGYLVDRRVVAVTRVVVSGGADPEVQLELQRVLPGLHIGDEINEIVEEVLRRHSRIPGEYQILVIAGGAAAGTSVIAIEKPVGVAPLDGVDRVLRKVFRPEQYELYFGALVAEAQRSIWQAKKRCDTAAEVREYVWFFINLMRMVPSWVWAIALRAVAGMMSRP